MLLKRVGLEFYWTDQRQPSFWALQLLMENKL